MNHQVLIEGLKRLRLRSMAEDYAEVARQCEKVHKSYEQYLGLLVETELKAKHQAKIDRLTKQANLIKGKTIATYDYKNRKGITAKQVERLSQGHFLREGTNIVLYGDFGVGKSHIAEGLTRALCGNGFRCLLVGTHQLINEMVAAQKTLDLASLFKKLDRYDLLTIDELGYCPHSKDGADLFFQLISQRYERRSIMITTNLTFSEWDKVFLNQITTAAAIDRIIHKCETFNITGPSWRREEAEKRAESSKKKGL
jgi:DNA replication protein DnaC